MLLKLLKLEIISSLLKVNWFIIGFHLEKQIIVQCLQLFHVFNTKGFGNRNRVVKKTFTSIQEILIECGFVFWA